MASLRLVAVVAAAWCLGGCAVTGPLGSMFSGTKEDSLVDGDGPTGSIAKPASTSAGALPLEADLAYTRLALVDVLKHGRKEVSAPWENPATGARGTVTPIASDYQRDGTTCRDFLASYVRRGGSETWMQGDACKSRQGAWEVKSLRPWSRS